MTRGAIYVVVGDEDRQRYIEAAARSIRSLRKAMPKLPIALASDRPTDTSLSEHKIRVAGGDGYRAKILAIRATPFDKTIFLDADTFVVSHLGDVFDLLDEFDIAVAHAPGRVNMAFADIPESFAEFNTGVIAVRRSAPVTSFLDAWLGEYDRLLPSAPTTQDQPSFRRAAYCASDVRIATLPPEFNQRFELAGFQNYQVRVLHGWGDDRFYDLIAEAMRQPTTRVFAGRRLYNGHGKLELDFSEHRKFKRLRSLLLRYL